MKNSQNISFINTQVNYLTTKCTAQSSTISTLHADNEALVRVCATHRTSISTLQDTAQHTDRRIVDYKQRIVDLEQSLNTHSTAQRLPMVYYAR